MLELGKVIREGHDMFCLVIALRDNFSSFLTAGESELQEPMKKVRDLHMHIKPVQGSNRLLSLTVPQI